MSHARTLHAALVVVAFCAIAGTAYAQADRGTITGQVIDQSAAIIPGATVKAIHVATNFEREVTTSAEGLYTITHYVAVEFPSADADRIAPGVLNRHSHSFGVSTW